jgi:hypothetical protein
MARLLNLNTVLILIVALLLISAVSSLKTTAESNLRQGQEIGQCLTDRVVGGPCR